MTQLLPENSWAGTEKVRHGGVTCDRMSRWRAGQESGAGVGLKQAPALVKEHKAEDARFQRGDRGPSPRYKEPAEVPPGCGSQSQGQSEHRALWHLCLGHLLPQPLRLGGRCVPPRIWGGLCACLFFTFTSSLFCLQSYKLLNLTSYFVT